MLRIGKFGSFVVLVLFLTLATTVVVFAVDVLPNTASVAAPEWGPGTVAATVSAKVTATGLANWVAVYARELLPPGTPTPTVWNLVYATPVPPNMPVSFGASLNFTGLSPNGKVYELWSIPIAATPTDFIPTPQVNEADLRGYLGLTGNATATPIPPAEDIIGIDSSVPKGYAAVGPQPGGKLACRSFEVFALAKDPVPVNANNTPEPEYARYSGFGQITVTGQQVVQLGLQALELQPMALATPASGPGLADKRTVINLADGATSLTLSLTAKDKVGNQSTASIFSNADVSDVPACPQFSDVEAGSWYEPYVNYMAAAGLIKGYGGGLFGPADYVTRAHLAALLTRALNPTEQGLPTSAPSGCSFVDVPATAWYAKYVWYVCQNGLMSSYAGGKFEPDVAATRADTAVGIWALNVKSGGYVASNSVLKASDTEVRGNEPFTDVVTGDQFYNAVNNLYKRGVIDGTSATTFSPNDPLTRAAIAKILYRALAVRMPFS
jgi:hypothetical protein